MACLYRYILSLCVLLFCLLPVRGQEKKDTLLFRVMSYNVENLFDWKHDTLKNDYDFLPDATRHWTYARYKKKLNRIARVITALGEWQLPALVGLCEVENNRVLRDLTRYSLLREAGYRYILADSPDERGIDVALLYQRGVFKPLSVQSLNVPPPRPDSRPTRHVLHVSGLLLSGDTLDVLVVHFPSRAQGARRTEAYRINAAKRVRQAADSVLSLRRKPQILIMGDMNETSDEPAVQLLLNGFSAEGHNFPFYNLITPSAGKRQPKGTYKYRGVWQQLDYLMVSPSLMQPDASMHILPGQAGIFHTSFLLCPDRNYGGMQPHRTFHGMKYQDGTSDHLPVWADFHILY